MPTLLTQELAAPIKRHVTRGEGRFIPFPGKTQRAIFSYCAPGESHRAIDVGGGTYDMGNSRAFTFRFLTISEAVEMKIPLPTGEADLKGWSDTFLSKNCVGCKSFCDDHNNVVKALRANSRLADLPLAEVVAAVEQFTPENPCRGVEYVHGVCQKGIDVTAERGNIGCAVMQVPELCLCSTYKQADNEPLTSTRLASSNYNLFAYRERAEVPEIAPYTPANVHGGSASICWGRNGTPADPKKAMAIYWGSGFNRDLSTQRANTLKGTLEGYKQLSSGYGQLKNYLYKNVIGINQPTIGLFISSYRNIMAALPKCVVDVKGSSLVFAWVLSNRNGKYQLYCNGFEFEMEALNGSSPIKFTQHKK